MHEEQILDNGMKYCFGVNLGWFMEDLIGTPEQVKACYDCPDFARCQQMAMVRQMVMLRHEIRRTGQQIVQALGSALR
jgi:hypothetical protein